jgi:hypothetical protein
VLSRTVIGTEGPVAWALRDGTPADATPQIVIVALPEPVGPVGALPTAALAALIDATLTPALAALRAAAADGGPVRAAIVCPAGAVLPDHRDGARSVAAAGLAMLAEVAAATPGLAANVVAVADAVPVAEVAAAVELALAQPSMNGATIRLDGGRDAALAAETRAEGD